MKPFKNWKTTIAGVFAIISGVASCVEKKNCGPEEISAIITGAGLLFAKDDLGNNDDGAVR